MQQKSVLLLGLGISGQAAAHFLLRRGAKITAVDGNKSLIETSTSVAELRAAGVDVRHESEVRDVSEFDLLVVSPGISETHPLYKLAVAKGLKVVGELELACREIKQKCVAITGTNGKTTVTSLVAHVLTSSGISAKALGNIGIPLASAVDEQDNIDVYVIEVSSFQLETLRGRYFDAAVVLNITPDHLDRYHTMIEYAKAKIRIKDNLKVGRKLYIEDKCKQQFASLIGDHSCLTYGYSENCHLSTDTKDVLMDGQLAFKLPFEYQNRRSHDVENLMAAYGLCAECGVDAESFVKALATFTKPAHRIQYVKTVAGVHFYDDSKGTNIDAVIRAVETIDSDIVLIAGGVDKGFPYTSWIEAFAGKVKVVCAIGESAQKIKNDLGHQIHVELFPTLDTAVNHAAQISKEGGSVLLSPGCSSYDMFKDYAHRGNEFQRIVNSL